MKRLHAIAVALLAAATLPSHARLSLTAGLETTSGSYGRASSTTQTVAPLRADWQATGWRLRADLPLQLRTDGPASALDREQGGIGAAGPSRAQSGVSDLTLSGWYALRAASARVIGVEVGARLKTPLAARERCLLTSGGTDLSFEARLARPIERTQSFATLGYTLRDDVPAVGGCPGGRGNGRNPFYLDVGLAWPVARFEAEVEYSYRQPVVTGGAATSEVSVELGYQATPRLDVIGHALVGFSDTSPDYGLGVRARWRF